ncbi:MAG: DUF6515 family protein [Rikenellaceae bacterium]
MKTSKIKMNWHALLIAIFASTTIMTASAETTSNVLSRSIIIRDTKESKEVKSLSKGYTTTNYQDLTYYQSKGRYYVEVADGYKTVAPPTGITVSELPKGYSVVSVLNRKFYSCRGVIYKESSSGGYEIALPEIGMILPELPEADIREVLIDGDLYFEVAGFVYKSVASDEQYVVVCTFDSLNV